MHGDLRRFAFAFQEGLFECMASRYLLVGTFASYAEALVRALDPWPRTDLTVRGDETPPAAEGGSEPPKGPFGSSSLR